LSLERSGVPEAAMWPVSLSCSFRDGPPRLLGLTHLRLSRR
jgi:hypothetical protein